MEGEVVNLESKEEEEKRKETKIQKEENQDGVLFAGGLITGESLMGLFMAIPIVASSNAQILSLVLDPPMWPGVLFIVFCMIWLYSAATVQGLKRVLGDIFCLVPCRNWLMQRASSRSNYEYSQL